MFDEEHESELFDEELSEHGFQRKLSRVMSTRKLVWGEIGLHWVKWKLEYERKEKE